MTTIILDQPKTGQQRPKSLARVETPGGGYAELLYRFDPKFEPHGTFQVIVKHKHERAKKATLMEIQIEKDATVNFELVLQRPAGTVWAARLSLDMEAFLEGGEKHTVQINRRIPLQ